MTNTTPTTYSDLVTLCARSAIEQGADDSYVCQSGDFEALADFAGSEPGATTRDELARDVRAAIREEISTAAAMATYTVQCRHASGSSCWEPEPECVGLTRDEAERVLATLEPTDDDGAALEYRIVED